MPRKVRAAPVVVAQATLDLVIPVLDEESRIGPTVAALGDMIVARALPVRLVVVDNGCVDTTASVVDCVQREHLELEVISCRVRGKGAAVRAGVMRSRATWVGYCDADLPVPPEALSWAVDLLHLGWEVVIGSRRCAGASYAHQQSLGRRLGSAAFRATSKKLRGPIADTQCGFKFFDTAVAQRLFADMQVSGFAFDLEIVAKALRSKARLIELPLPWYDRDGSSFRPVTDGIRAALDMRQVRRSVRQWAEPE